MSFMDDDSDSSDARREASASRPATNVNEAYSDGATDHSRSKTQTTAGRRLYYRLSKGQDDIKILAEPRNITDRWGNPAVVLRIDSNVQGRNLLFETRSPKLLAALEAINKAKGHIAGSSFNLVTVLGNYSHYVDKVNPISVVTPSISSDRLGPILSKANVGGGDSSVAASNVAPISTAAIAREIQLTRDCLNEVLIPQLCALDSKLSANFVSLELSFAQLARIYERLQLLGGRPLAEKLEV